MAPLPELILASTSRYRAQLLERLGLPFRSRAPECDEEALKAKLSPRGAPLAPRELAARLALAKAESLRALEPRAVILGGDQIATRSDGAILSKPGSAERACEQLEGLAGRTHLLITSVVIVTPEGRALTHTDISRLTMRPLTRAAIARYVAADSPLDCAGSYAIERRGIALFARLKCADQTAITGLPLMAVTKMLVSLGYAIP
jgi:septum formation protein